MSILLFIVASFAAISGSFPLPIPQEVGVARNFKSIETIRVRGPGHLHVPVNRKPHRNPKRKRQSYDSLRNDMSGYSIQSLILCCSSRHI